MGAEAACLVRDKQLLVNGKPVVGGVLDARMGVSRKSDECQTCKQALKQCKGHFGVIELARPVFHIGYFKHTLHVLQCVCKSCSRVLLPVDQREALVKSLAKPDIDSFTRELLYRRVLVACRKVDVCGFCGMPNGPVRKAPNANALRILHDMFQTKAFQRSAERMDARYRQVEAAVHHNGAMVNALREASVTITPQRAVAIMQRIPDEDLPLLWAHSLRARPENLVLSSLLVPPVAIRPSVSAEGGAGTTEDDITVKLQEIVIANENLHKQLAEGSPLKTVQETFDQLSNAIAQLFNGDAAQSAVSAVSADKAPRAGGGGGLGRSAHPEQPDHKPVEGAAAGDARQPSEARRKTARKTIRGIIQRIKGKQGRFRGNLSGKRVDFSGRTVISPDPNLGVQEVGLPLRMALRLTFPEVVTPLNLEAMRAAVRSGPKRHPGATMVRCADGRLFDLKVAKCEQLAAQLRVGDTVDRHVRDGDIVLFNRQPSLHRMSIMAHEVRVLEGHTLRFNECCCAPYNADFDGDEMNVHVPQTLEACAEARLLMAVPKNLVTPRNGEPLVAATQDFITGSFLLTSRDTFFTRAQFCQVAAQARELGDGFEVPMPAVLRPVPLWTGKQVWSAIVRGACARTGGVVNLLIKERLRLVEGEDSLCPNEGLVEFRHNELIYGALGKQSLGGSKQSVFYALLRDVGESAAVDAMNRMTKLVPRWMANQGFSFSILDVVPPPDLLAKKHAAIAEGFETCLSTIANAKAGKLALKAGCDLEETLESTVSGTLSRLRDLLGQRCMESLPPRNAAKTMAACGSKGSALNICQMVICVGQQIVGGKRIPNGFDSRALPHFALNAKEPAAKGFVQSSFFSGLSPSEFFFHTMAGREGLVDTAVKTAETGYMARRLVKALEDLALAYDGTVRDASNCVVQFIYGDDGLSPLAVEKVGPVDFARLAQQVRPGEPATAEELPCFVGGRPAAEGDYDPGRALFERCLAEEALKVDADKRAAFTSRATRKARLAIAEPGEAVGALAAQSLGEPGTQMTLKTFHFAGVASMNVTLGVPRLKEIINASKAISTPFITARLCDEANFHRALSVKAAVERTTLAQLARQVEVQWREARPRVVVFLCAQEHRDSLGLGFVDAEYVSKRVLANRAALKIAEDADRVHVDRTADAVVVEMDPGDKVVGDAEGRVSLMASALKLKADLLDLVVVGNKLVSRAVINVLEDAGRVDHVAAEQPSAQERANAKLFRWRVAYRAEVLRRDENVPRSLDQHFEVLVEGKGLLDVLGTWGVDYAHTRSNDIMEIAEVLGVEAARKVIVDEVKYILERYGLAVDIRHLSLLADVMTYRGTVLGITRFGIAKMKDSVVSLASFERTADHLLDGAAHGRRDDVRGVSECVVVGQPIPCGTGVVHLVSAEDVL